MTKIDVSIDELAAARAVILAVHPEESDADHGVALAVSGGTRRWTAWSGEAIASTAEFPAGLAPDGGALVSRRAVEFAAILAERHDLDSVELVFSGIGVAIAAGPVAVHVEQPEPRAVPAPIDPFVGEGARARVAGPALFDLLAMGRILPAGVDLAESDEPQFHLLVGSGTVTGLVDWPETGVGPTQFKVSGSTTGDGVAVISPALAARVVGTERPCEMTITVPATGESWVEIAGSRWTARIWADEVEANDDGLEAGDRRDEDDEQLTIPFTEWFHVPGSLRPDPLAGASIADVRAFAIDPDVDSRIAAAQSRANWDGRVQLTLAADLDERVVLTLLDDVDPCEEACEIIIDGPHVQARRVLAGRNLPSVLLGRLARDTDETTRALAVARLQSGGHAVPVLETA